SPGALKVAMAVALPPASRSIAGFALSNVTAPGPRNMLHVIASGGIGGNSAEAAAAPRPRPREGEGGGMFSFGPSSVTHVVSASGSPAEAVYLLAMVVGGPVKSGPPGSNMNTGGVFFCAASSYGSTIHSGRVCIVVVLVKPFATIVQVIFLLPRSFGTLIVNTPHWRFGRKCVGWPWSASPGSTRLFGPGGMADSCLVVRVE